MVAAVTVEREDIRVMFLRATADTPEAIQRAWAQFEVAVELKGRKFFGVFDPVANEYRACAQLTVEDDPEALGFEEGILPGGTYLRARLHGEPPAVYEKIAPTVQELEQQARVDPSRPIIEFYRSRDVIDVLVPIM